MKIVGKMRQCADTDIVLDSGVESVNLCMESYITNLWSIKEVPVSSITIDVEGVTLNTLLYTLCDDHGRSDFSRRVFEDVLLVAQHFGEEQNRDVTVILTMAEKISRVGYLEVVEMLDDYLGKCSKVCIALENPPIFTNAGELNSACDPNTVPKFVEDMRAIISNGDRLRVAFDFESALKTIRAKNSVFSRFDMEIYDIVEYMSSICKVADIIRFSYPLGYGVGEFGRRGFPEKVFHRFWKIIRNYIQEDAELIIETGDKLYKGEGGLSKMIELIETWEKEFG